MLPVHYVATSALTDLLKYTLVRGIVLSPMGLRLEFATLNGQPVILSYSSATGIGSFTVKNDGFESSKSSNYFSSEETFLVILRATTYTLGLHHKTLDFSITPLNSLLEQLLDGKVPFKTFFIQSKKEHQGVYEGAINGSDFEICNIRPKSETWSMFYKSPILNSNDMSYDEFIARLIEIGALKN